MKDDKVPLKTILQNFIYHVENLEARLKEDNDLYESEFQELKAISDSLKTQKYYACTEGEKSVNRRKNRYKDILPFDVSRVMLSEFPGVTGSDYINANYIRGASGSPAYIASQGPLPHTVADFWRMAVECEVQVIVMACNQTEAGKHKCEQYVPDEQDAEETFGDVAVTLSQSRQVCPDFTVRKLAVRYTGPSGSREERLVCQFHYSAWPDHGVPSSVVPLLRMIRMLRDTQASETLPLLVHCSAGCGRTGTVCAIDYVWGLLKAGKLTPAFSLFDLVAEMRRQRIAMVQTKDQYMLVHRAVRQLFADQLRVIESHPYANVDSAGRVVKAADSGDYEEVCLTNEVPSPAQKRLAPSPPPQIKPPPRKNAPRHRLRPPPLPDKRRPQEERAGAEYGGSLGRRASVHRLRQVFEPAAPRLSRSKSSAALRCRPRPPPPELVPPPPPAFSPPPAPPSGRAKSPPEVHPVPRAKWPPDMHPAPGAKSPPEVHPVAGGTSPPEVQPVNGTRTVALSGVTVNHVAAAEPAVRGASRAAGKLTPQSDYRPVLPIKRSKSLKLAPAPLRVQRPGPAYLALESRLPPDPGLPLRVTAPDPGLPLRVNVSAPAVSPSGSPPRYVNIDLLRRYEERLVERSRELGLSDTPPEPRLLSPALVTAASPRGLHRPANYPNCTPQARHNLRRIEADLQRNQRSGFYDTSDGRPASPRGWHARERRNSFRQAVEGRPANYEAIWVGGETAGPCASLPAEVESAAGPAVVPAASYIVQGGAEPPLQVGNSRFWSAAPSHTVTANSVFYSGPPSASGLSVSENSAFRPYLPDKAAAPNYAAVHKPTNGGSPRRSDAAGRGGAEAAPGVSADPAQQGPVAPPRRRASCGLLPSRLSVSQPQLVGPSHLFLADVQLDGVGGGAVGEDRASDTESLPPAVPEKTQAAYQVPTPGRDVMPPPPRPASETAEGEAALGLRPDPAEPGPLNKALDRLQATASSLRSRLSGRAEPSVTGLSTHSRQAYI